MADPTTTPAPAESERRRSGSRSPNYPNIDLAQAVERMRTLYEHEHRHATPIDVAAGHWGYSVTSSSIDKVVGALNAYGLIDVQGSGREREIALSSRGLDIVEDHREESPERDRALQDAALTPPVFRTIREKWGRTLPSDGAFRTYLIRELNFNPNTVDGAIANYRSTIEYAGLDKAEEKSYDGGAANDKPPLAARVQAGQFVQWTSQDVAQFITPRKVLGLSDDGEYAFVEGTPTGIPVSQLSVESAPETTAGGRGTPPVNPFSGGSADRARQSGTKEDVFALDRGQVLVRWPEELTAQDFADIKDWLAILERKIGRSVKPDAAKSE